MRVFNDRALVGVETDPLEMPPFCASCEAHNVPVGNRKSKKLYWTSPGSEALLVILIVGYYSALFYFRNLDGRITVFAHFVIIALFLALRHRLTINYSLCDICTGFKVRWRIKYWQAGVFYVEGISQETRTWLETALRASKSASRLPSTVHSDKEVSPVKKGLENSHVIEPPVRRKSVSRDWLGVVVIGLLLLGLAVAVVLIRRSDSRKADDLGEIMKLADAYYEGNNLDSDRDLEKARGLFIRAANLGDPRAQCQVGVIYANGEGVEVDIREALYWFHRSAMQHNQLAFLCLSQIYGKEVFGFLDIQESMCWLEEGAELGLAEVQVELGLASIDGDHESIGKDGGRFWLTCAAQSGNSDAQQALGYHLVNGTIGVVNGEVDFDSGLYWYWLSVGSKNKLAVRNLAELFELGIGLDQSPADARYMYNWAAQLGEPIGQYKTALYYIERGAPSSLREALRLLELSANQDCGLAQHRLAFMYLKGTGTRQDSQQAMHWFSKAANQGFADSQFMMGQIFAHGLCGVYSYDNAMYWYGKAAEQGHRRAAESRRMLAINGLNPF